jgi:hypothetical protein
MRLRRTLRKKESRGRGDMAKIKTSSAKAKGRSLQQWTCQKISELLGIPWGKDESIASREMGQPGTDIRLVGEAQERFPFSVECKWQESWSVLAWIKQAQENQKAGTDWLLVMKKNRIKPVVVIDAERFFELLGKIGGKANAHQSDS